MNTNERLILNWGNDFLIITKIGYELYEKFCEADRIEDLIKIHDFLKKENIAFGHKDYFKMYLNNEISEEDFFLGLNIYKLPRSGPEIKMGMTTIPIDFIFGKEYKENKSVNSKGEIVERTYYGKSKKIDREVISYVIRFTNGKVDKYEDRSDDSYFYLNYPRIGSEEGIGHMDSLFPLSRVLVAFSDTESDYTEKDIGEFKDLVSNLYSKDYIQRDKGVKSIYNFKRWNSNGESDAFAYIRELDNYKNQDVNKEIILHGANALKKIDRRWKDAVIKDCEEFLNAYDKALIDIRKVQLMTTLELKENNISFNDKRGIIDKIVIECQENLHKNFETFNDIEYFENEVAIFREEYEAFKQRTNLGCSFLGSLGDKNKSDSSSAKPKTSFDQFAIFNSKDGSIVNYIKKVFLILNNNPMERLNKLVQTTDLEKNQSNKSNVTDEINSSQIDYSSKLKELKQLYDSEIISEQDYETKKKEYLEKL